MERYKIYVHQFISKIKDVDSPVILLSTILVTMVVSVLISVGVSSKELTRRLGEYHESITEGQRDIIESLMKRVEMMKEKQEEVEGQLTDFRVNMDRRFDHQNSSIELTKSQVYDVSEEERRLSKQLTSDYEALNDQISDTNIKINNVDNMLSNYKVENENSNRQVWDKIFTLDDKIDQAKEANKDVNGKLASQKVLVELQGKDIEKLQAMYSKISLTATIMAKASPADTFTNITDILHDIENSIADQFESKIKIETLNITNFVAQKQKETLKSSLDYSEKVKSLLLRFYSQFQASFLSNLGYVKIPNTGHYHVSTDYKSWFEARKACEYKLGYLVEFHNQEEEANVTKFVQDQFNVGRFWIGAFDPSKPNNGKLSMSSTHGRHGGEKCIDRDEDTFCHNQGLDMTDRKTRIDSNISYRKLSRILGS